MNTDTDFNEWICIKLHPFRLGQRGNIKVMEVFGDCGVQPQGNTLTASISSGQMQYVVYLLEQAGIDVNSKNSQGHSAIHMACKTDRFDMLK